MRKIQILLLIVAVSFSSLLSANNNPTKRKLEPAKITNAIGKLLEKPTLDIKDDITANVTIALNKNNEIVVLSVDTENSWVTSYIKERLNYQKLENLTIRQNKTFVVPVRITAS